MQKIIFEIITDLTRQKHEARTEPTVAILREITNELNRRKLQALQDLETAGKIVSGKTINDKYFKINV
jgi:hypothetical protein